jgi:PPOX class probable F420-dependent enzyme
MDASEPILSDAERGFLAGARRAVLVTTDDTGGARPVPICFVVLGDPSRPVVLSPLDEKPKRVADPHRLARVRDIAARPAVSLLVDRWDEDWTRLGWLRCRAAAAILEPDDPTVATERATAIAALRAKYPQYRAQDLETRPILALAVSAATSWGDLEARAGARGP